MNIFQRVYYKTIKSTVGLKTSNYCRNKFYFDNKKGIEIGGPSRIFAKDEILPVYKDATIVDGVNFSTKTVWENIIEPGNTYRYMESKIGYQYISEASNLLDVPSNSYDFLISSHCLEHCGNVILTLKEWLRVIKPGGAILIIVPDKRRTFDHNRPTTSLEHILEDYELNRGEDDMTHLPEILALHDIAKDPGVNDYDTFKARSLDNLNNRCFHQHVFDIDLLKSIFELLKIDILFTEHCFPYHQIIMGIKA